MSRMNDNQDADLENKTILEDKNESQVISVRKEKRLELMRQGINPYPYKYNVTHHTDQIKELSDEQVSLAGRVMTKRNLGKLSFAHLRDQEGNIQLCFDQNTLGIGQYKFYKKYIDSGDIVGVIGTSFRTQTGELTIKVKKMELLTKAIHPLPDKYHGVVDKGILYRHRSLDLIVNPNVREIFRKRSQAIQIVRNVLNNEGFIEVEIPTLQLIYGGASARPFSTHINALGKEVYLSISPEIYLKRLIVGGLERVYTICKNFRNEGIDKTHNPEFTMMECYQAFADYHDMMAITEKIYETVFSQINKSLEIRYHDKNSSFGEVNLNFKAPWKRESMLDLVGKVTGIDAESLPEEQLRKEVVHYNKEMEQFAQNYNWGELVQYLFENYCEQNLIQPTFVIDHPKESSPLCKVHRNDSRLIERFEPFVYGMEIGNAYSELNDPVLQRALLEDQMRQREKTGKEVYPMDEDFCYAMNYGMSPTGGLGLGIDRLVMLLTAQTSIRDVILFPLVK